MMLDGLFARKLLMVTGKGGTGKTLLSASLGQIAASLGKKVLVVECHRDSQLRPLLGGENKVDEAVQAEKNLHWINLVPKNGLQHYVVGRLKKAGTWNKFFKHSKITAFFEAMPGLTEVMILGRLFHDVMLIDQWDLVIFDGPASGHYASMLETPAAILGAGILGPLASEVKRVKDFLEDSELCEGLYVTLPEPLVISECAEFVPKLELPKKHHVILNRSLYSDKDFVSDSIPVQEWLNKRDELTSQAMKDLEGFGSFFQILDLGAVSGALSLKESKQLWGYCD
ncbi:MAG: ArsA-related P-loop ATPase [Oligoflexales bacterium]